MNFLTGEIKEAFLAYIAAVAANNIPKALAEINEKDAMALKGGRVKIVSVNKNAWMYELK